MIVAILSCIKKQLLLELANVIFVSVPVVSNDTEQNHTITKRNWKKGYLV